MKQIILGTAGHIDHGKTAFIKAISGIDTDRLKEEKERGITIELGFASIDLPSGQHIGIVDVPGHEKFVKNMVAGATGIDIVAMVIAADEGVMPQTREHMEICTLLGIKHGFVVLSKSDLVDEEWMDLVVEDIKDFTANTFLEDQPVIPVSAITRQGISAFIEALDQLSAEIPSRSSAGLLRLPADRVFSMRGFGTVITGTLISGHIRVGDPVMLYPSRISSKVRGLQVHNQSVVEAEAGMRTAINFQGLAKDAVKRGDVIARPNTLKPSYMLDVQFHFLKSNPKSIKNRSLVRFHAGTSEILGHLILLERQELAPGDTTVAQLRLNAPVALMKDDRFVIRSYSPVRTVGGGQILNPIPRKHKRFNIETIDGLQRLSEQKTEEIIAYHIRESSYQGTTFADLMIMTNLAEKPLQHILLDLMSKQDIIQTDKENKIFIHAQTLETLMQELENHLVNYHKSHPLKPGMPREELKSKFPAALSPKIFNLLLNQLIKNDLILAEEDIVRLKTHVVSLQTDQADVRKKILAIYQSSRLQPPYFKEISQTLQIEASQAKDVLMLLVEEGLLLKIKEDLYFTIEAVEDLKKRLIDFLKIHAQIDTPQFKEMTGASRKYVIPLIEYFDAAHVTIRIGDIRKLRSR